MDILILTAGGFLYTILAIIVGFRAEKLNRNYWIWLLISFVITPIIAFIILTCVGKKIKKTNE
jgi:biotin transporter BioY